MGAGEPTIPAASAEESRELVVTPRENGSSEVGAEEIRNTLLARQPSVVPEEEFEKFKRSDFYRDRKKLFPMAEDDASSGEIVERQSTMRNYIIKRHNLKVPIVEEAAEGEDTAKDAVPSPPSTVQAGVAGDQTAPLRPYSL